MAHIGHPLLGDALYGGAEGRIGRPALHSWRTRLVQPVTGERLLLAASPIARDMAELAGEGLIGTLGRLDLVTRTARRCAGRPAVRTARWCALPGSGGDDCPAVRAARRYRCRAGRGSAAAIDEGATEGLGCMMVSDVRGMAAEGAASGAGKVAGVKEAARRPDAEGTTADAVAVGGAPGRPRAIPLELLAPAGGPEQLAYAIRFGADAV